MFLLKQWLNEEKLAQRLIELIHPERDEEVESAVSIATCTPVCRTERVHVRVLPPPQRQSNASQTLCDIIRLSRDQANQLQEMSQPDPLLTVLES